MRALLLAGLMMAGTVGARVLDQGWRYVVYPEEVVSTDGRNSRIVDDNSSVLIRYNLSDLPLDTSLNSVIWYKGKASGSGANPSFAVWAVDDAGAKIERISEVTIRPDTDGPIPFPVTEYVSRHLKDETISFRIEMRSAPGFSQAVEFSETPSLAVVKAQAPFYDLQALLHPVWHGSRMANETVLPTSYEGGPAAGNLAFVPSKIVSVRNYALDTTYEEGKDYVVEDRSVRLVPGSSIPFLRHDELYHDNPNGKPNVMRTVSDGYLTFSEGPFFNDKQLVVTYEHDALWGGPVPQSAKDFLPQTFQIFEKGIPLKLAVFGDSISVGSSASGKCIRPPFMPRWGDLVAAELQRFYGSDIDCINPSLGGMRSDWGRDTVDGLLSFEKPDLVILGFGMNDAGVPFSETQYADNIRAIMKSLRKQNPNVEFILLMSFQPNSKWRSLEPMPGYLEALKEMQGSGVAIVDIWSLHGYLLEDKTYWDMTGNHVNHPNDFIVRIYAQALLSALGIE